jgi:hypothetical protein
MLTRLKQLMRKIITHPVPYRVALAKELIRHLPLLSYEHRLRLAAVDRPNYGYCIYGAANLASRLGYPKISVLEFGCGGGRGLLNAEMHIGEIEKIFPVSIELYGFDIGSGLPEPQDYRDMPYYFRSGLYEMNTKALAEKLKIAKVVIGDVKDTCSTFFANYAPAPVGCVFHDLDFYSATRDALHLLEEDAKNLLPRIFMYFDDIIGDDVWLCNDFTGERLAIREFNQRNANKKIDVLHFLPEVYPYETWTRQIYAFHDFEHPRYNDFVADAEQIRHEARIKLSRSS